MTSPEIAGFVRAQAGQLVDDRGEPLVLRGVGLGNWLLPEGYMWKFGDEIASPRQIEARVESLVGAERAAEFWRRFRGGFITEADIDAIADLGFDHVRLPMNARHLWTAAGDFNAAEIALVDACIDWCEARGMRVLLDLHGAAGGQTGTNIDDSPDGRPDLFVDPEHQRATVDLWRALAARYRQRTAVLGYDLLNEPLPNEWQHTFPDQLVALYKRITAAIRDVDPDHLIMYEGTHWATNWDIFTEVWDANSALQFHRYWCPPDESSIAPYLEARERLGLPIFMGEGGENTADWIYAATRLYERHGIGWNFWPWKKLATATSPLSMPMPANWHLISNPDERPAPDVAWGVLEAYLDAMAPEACDARRAVTDALFANAPLVVAAWAATPSTPGALVLDRVLELPDGIWHHTAGESYTARSAGV